MIALCVMWQGDVEEDESVPDKESDILLRNHLSGGSTGVQSDVCDG